MKSSWLSDKGPAFADYESSVAISSQVMPGVRFSIPRMSFARRTELLRGIRDLAAKLPFLASSSEFGEKIEAGLTEQAIEELYVRWGLLSISGLRIDGQEADVDLLIQKGPESLAREIATAIKAQTL